MLINISQYRIFLWRGGRGLFGFGFWFFGFFLVLGIFLRTRHIRPILLLGK